MHIKVFGPGCAKCEEAKNLVEKVVKENNIPATVEKISNLQEMMHLGIISTPAVVIDNVVKCSGRVPTAAELLGWVSSPNAEAAPAAPANGACGCSCGGKC